MTSFIDPSVPIFGSPTTASVRHNFLIAKQEIEALQSAVGLTVPVSVANGGTGATTMADALENLGAVAVSGDTMTGPLILSENPTNLMEAATKLYVDNYFPVTVVNGGTGANNPTDALANLGGAPLASPIFTGIPSAPTPPTSDSSTILATTGFVHAVVSAQPVGITRINAGPGLSGGGTGSTVTVSLSMPVSVNNGGTGANNGPAALTNLGGAPIASPAFTGNPTAPTVAVTSANNTSIATTAFVQSAIDARGFGTVNGIVAGQGLTGGGSTGTVTVALTVPVTVPNGGTGTTLLGNNAVLVGSGAAPIRAGNMTLDTSGNLHVFGTAQFDGAVTLAADPTAPLGAATKQYVDSHTAGILGVTAGTGLTGGGTSGTVTVALQVPVSVANGGTGATTAPAALTSLGAAPIGSPAFAGVPTAPTATAGTNTTQLATTAFVTSAVAAAGGGTITGVTAGNGLAGGGTSGTVTVALVAPVSIANGGTGATGAGAALTSLGAAPLNSPNFTGSPTAPTPVLTDNTTAIATTAFVKGQGYAPLANPTFSGVPSGPTATAGTSTTQLATTAFVGNAVAGYLPLSGGTLTGPLNLSGLPTTNSMAANKQYVDTAVAGVSVATTLTGDVTGTGTGTVPTTVVQLQGRAVASTAPTANQVLQWSGTSWAPGTVVGGATISDVAPTANPGALWWDSVGGQLYVRYNDGTSTQWVAASSMTIGPSSPLPVGSGGTGATTAPAALANLGALPLVGGTLSGNLWINGASLYFGNTTPSPAPLPGSIVNTSTLNTIISAAAGSATGLATNLYNDGTNWRYLATGPALLARTAPDSTAFDWWSAPSGTSGAVATVTQFARISSAGSLFLSGTDAFVTLTPTAQWPTMYLRKAASGMAAMIFGQLGTVNRWSVTYGDNTAETGSSTGSNFLIARYNDAGTFLDNPITIYRNTATINHTGVIQSNIGYQCKAGSAGGFNANTFNIEWPGGGAHLWIDNVNQGTISVTSDYRIKKDVMPLGSMWGRVKELKPIRYTQAEYHPEGASEGYIMFPVDDVERWGFIAHELQETLIPSAASGVKDQPDAIQSLNLAVLFAALTSALQEAMGRIEALEGAA